MGKSDHLFRDGQLHLQNLLLQNENNLRKILSGRASPPRLPGPIVLVLLDRLHVSHMWTA